MEQEHLVANASWLAGKSINRGYGGVAEEGNEGSLMTIFFDLFVSWRGSVFGERADGGDRCWDNLDTIEGLGSERSGPREEKF
jgi:hypothetical protein